MLGRDDDHVGGLERAHQAYLDAGEALRAVRCAFWIGVSLMLRGEALARRDGSVAHSGSSSARGMTVSSGAIC